MVLYLKNLCQLHLLVVKDGVDAVDGLLGLVRCAPLGFLMQDGNQSPGGHISTNISEAYSSHSIQIMFFYLSFALVHIISFLLQSYLL